MIKSKKSNLHYTRLIRFRVSRVSGAHLCDFDPELTQSRLQRWRVVGNAWDIWSARDLNSIPPTPEANVLSLVLSVRSNKMIQMEMITNKPKNPNFDFVYCAVSACHHQLKDNFK